jgi:hypothetical protein
LPAPPLDPQAPPGQFTYVRMTLRAWWDNLPLILLAGFLFMVPCMPVLWLFFNALFVEAIIVGVLLVLPAWVALLAQLTDIARDVRTHIRVFFRALGHYWLRSVALGLLLAAPLLIAFLTLPALAQPTVPLVVWLGLAKALRNSLILSSRHIWNTLGLLGLGVLFILATIYVHSALIFLWPALFGLFVVNNCRMVVEEELTREPGSQAK